MLPFCCVGHAGMETAVLPQTMNMIMSRTNVLAQTGTLILWFIAGDAACVVNYINKSLSNWWCHCRRQRQGQQGKCTATLNGGQSRVLTFNTNMYPSSIANRPTYTDHPHLVSHSELPIYLTWQAPDRCIKLTAKLTARRGQCNNVGTDRSIVK